MVGGTGQCKKALALSLSCQVANLHAFGPVTVFQGYAWEPQLQLLPDAAGRLNDCSARATVDAKSAAIAKIVLPQSSFAIKERI